MQRVTKVRMKERKRDGDRDKRVEEDWNKEEEIKEQVEWQKREEEWRKEEEMKVQVEKVEWEKKEEEAIFSLACKISQTYAK